MNIPLESKIQSDIIKYLKTRPNSFTYKHEPIPTGMPDIHHIEYGNHYWFEVKRTHLHKPTTIQIHRHKQLRISGDQVYVVHNLQQVKDFFTTTLN